MKHSATVPIHPDDVVRFAGGLDEAAIASLTKQIAEKQGYIRAGLATSESTKRAVFQLSSLTRQFAKRYGRQPGTR